MAAPATDEWSSRRFLFVTGKGGVGKTTVTAAAALALAAQGKRVLATTCGAHERLSSMFGSAPLDHQLRLVADNVWATRIAPEQALEEYGEMVIKVKAIARAVFDNQYTHAFFRAVPGLYQWAMLGKAWFHTTERLDDGSPRFDVVLFDAPATGHGLDMLRVPKVILDIVPPGILRRDAERAWSMFTDPKQSGVMVVSLPEDMPTTETIELIQVLKDDLQLPLAQVLLNAMHHPLFSDGEREELLNDEALLALDAAEKITDSSEVALRAASWRAMRERIECSNFERLHKLLGYRPLTLPFLLDGAGSREGSLELASVLEKA